MKLETYLNAHEVAVLEGFEWMDNNEIMYQLRVRQAKAFRARILKMFVTNWRLPWEAAEQRCGELECQLKTERELHEREVAEKDEEIQIWMRLKKDYEDTIREKDRQIAILTEDKWNLKDEIAYYKGTLSAKDKRIAELDTEIQHLKETCCHD